MMSPSLVENTYNLIGERKKELPTNYISERVETVETAPSIDPREIFTGIKRYAPSPIWRFGSESKKFRAKIPILVKIYRDEDLFFAENEKLVVCGTGESSREALEDFCLHIVHFFEYYRNLDKGKLTGDALRLKALYENLLVEE